MISYKLDKIKIMVKRQKKKVKKAKRPKKIREKPQKVLFKTTTHPPYPPSLFTKGRAPKAKKLKKKISKEIKKATKKPQRPKLVKPPIKIVKPKTKLKIKPGRRPLLKLAKEVKPVEAPAYPVRDQRALRKARRKQISNGAYKTKIKIIGIGGGGSSIVSEMAQGVKKVNFVVANTDQKALKETSKKARHFQFGQKLTQGLGTGMNPELGAEAALEEKEKIKELLRGIDFCILVASLGGGTGSGASPVFAEISRRLKNTTLGIFTLPFNFEGEKKMELAIASLEKLKPNLNSLIIIPNERIFQIIEKSTSLKEALSIINKNLAESLESLIEMIYQPGLIKIDWASLKSILQGKGKLAFLNTVQIQGSKQAEESKQIEGMIKEVLSNPLYPYSPQGAAGGTLFHISGGLNLNVGEIEQIGKVISDCINPRAKVVFGISLGKEDKTKTTLLTNGCKWEAWAKKKEKPKGKVIKIAKTFPQEASGKTLEKKPEKKKTKKLKIEPGKENGKPRLSSVENLTRVKNV